MRSSSNQGRFQFTGQAYVPEVGLHYYKARMYNATRGRFMQTDPIGYKDDFDLYSYVYNDPLDKTDPAGTESADSAWLASTLAMEQATPFNETPQEISMAVGSLVGGPEEIVGLGAAKVIGTAAVKVAGSITAKELSLTPTKSTLAR